MWFSFEALDIKTKHKLLTSSRHNKLFKPFWLCSHCKQSWFVFKTNLTTFYLAGAQIGFICSGSGANIQYFYSPVSTLCYNAFLVIWSQVLGTKCRCKHDLNQITETTYRRSQKCMWPHHITLIIWILICPGFVRSTNTWLFWDVLRETEPK